jgi:phosphosulfolactate synthase
VSTSGPDFLSLPPRTSKPRRQGLTHVLDKGLSLVALESFVETAGAYIDFIKLGWGTAYVSGGVKAKVAICQEADINVCLGGTLLEVAAAQDKIDDYARWSHRLGIECIEVSNGALAMSADRKQTLIRELSGEFQIISEVGSKDPHTEVIPTKWVDEMRADVEAGASLLIAEGRESGTVGLFRSGGEINTDLVESIVSSVSPERIIFEAPLKDQQAWFISTIGSNVNLGNIAPDEVLSLETLRRGLRADTVHILQRSQDYVGGGHRGSAG